MDQRSDFISDFRARRIRTQITGENLSAIRDSFPEFIPRGRLQWNTHQVSVGHARGFIGGCGAVGGGWCARALGPVRLSRKILGDVELAAKSWQSSAENSGDFWDLCIIRRIVRGCTNHAPRTMSCDPAACED
jgi:hypothetical protein